MTTLVVDPAVLVVVANLQPLQDFHAPLQPSGERTVCGYPTHGWFPMSAGMAYNNVCSPCPRCFQPGGVARSTVEPGDAAGNSGSGWPFTR